MEMPRFSMTVSMLKWHTDTEGRSRSTFQNIILLSYKFENQNKSFHVMDDPERSLVSYFDFKIILVFSSIFVKYFFSRR